MTTKTHRHVEHVRIENIIIIIVYIYFRSYHYGYSYSDNTVKLVQSVIVMKEIDDGAINNGGNANVLLANSCCLMQMLFYHRN